MHRVARCGSAKAIKMGKRILLPFGRNQKEVPRRHEAEREISSVLLSFKQPHPFRKQKQGSVSVIS